MSSMFVTFTAIGIITMAGAKEISSSAERIVNSEKIDSAIRPDKAESWVFRNPKMIRFEPGGKENAQGTLIYNEDHGGLNKSMFPYIYGTHPLLTTAVLNLPLPPEKFNEYNQLSCLIYPDVPERAAVWFEVGGSGVWTQACRPLRPREWNRISICWSNHTPEQARKIKTAVVSRQVFGLLPGDAQWSRYYVKDFTLEKVVTGTEYGWDASPEKIILTQTGFAPGYSKKAILSPLHDAKDFALLENGKEVFTGSLSEQSFPTGKFKIADFSAFNTPGTYVIRSGNLVSAPFEISYTHLKNLAEKNRHFLHCMRSGTETPAHKACFLDDCIRSDNRQAVDVSGGWFDASDLRGYHSMAMKTILRPLASAYEFNTPELYQEMLWGAKQLDKLFDKETGLPYTVHSLYPKNNPDKTMQRLFTEGNFYKVNNYWTDNRPGTGDERAIHVAKGTYICHPDIMDSHWGLTAAGVWAYLAAKPEDKALAESILTKSKKHFDLLCDSSAEELRNNGIGYYNPTVNAALSLRLENAVALYRATGKTYYRELAFTLAKQLLARQERNLYETPDGVLTGFFRDGEKADTATLFQNDAIRTSFIRLIRDFPEEELFFPLHAALRIHADFYLLNPSATARPYQIPYPVLTTRKTDKGFEAEIGTSLEDGKKLYGRIPHSFLSGITGSAALETQSLAVFLNNPRLQEKASSFLNYHVGENPSGRGFIADAGTNFRRDIMSSALGWIPGMMSNPDIRDGIPGLPYNRHHSSNEIYTQTQAAYAVAANILAADAEITLEIRNAPENLSLTVHDILLNRDILKLQKLSPRSVLRLPGPATYQFRFSNGLSFNENIISGEKRTLVADMDRFVRIVSVELPKKMPAGQDFTAGVRVYYFGKEPQTVGIAAHGDNLTLSKKFIEQKIEPGKTVLFSFPVRAEKARKPYVFMGFPQKERNALVSASGIAVN